MLVIHGWKELALRGVAAIAFGIATIVVPGLTLFGVALLFGAYAFVDGVFALAAAFHPKRTPHRGILVFEGIAGVVFGVVTFAWPGITVAIASMLVGAWALMTGVAEIAFAVHVRRAVSIALAVALAGIASVVLGSLLLAWPLGGAVALVTLLGCYAFVFGCAMLVVAFTACHVSRDTETPHSFGPHPRSV